MEGLLLVNKPKGITSFDVIRQLRRTTGIKKIGHAGTLDPLASGLMLVLVGNATKQAGKLVKLDKEYIAKITLGAVSSTGDAEGELTEVDDRQPDLAEIQRELADYVGEFTISPPVYSAIKVGGQEAYKRARRGETFDLPDRKMTIYKEELLAYSYPVLKVRWHVSSGAYVRSLAEHFGAKLGTGAYLSGLSRTKVGTYQLEQAIELDSEPEQVSKHLIDKIA